MASTARTVVLTQALHMARQPLKPFLENAGNSPLAAEAVETVAAAAAAFTAAHDAVQCFVAAGGRGAGTIAVARGAGRGFPNASDTEGSEMTDEDRVMNSTAMEEMKEEADKGGQTGVASTVANVGRGGGAGGGGSGGGGSGSGAGAAAAEDVLAMAREDSAARVLACQEAMEGWWERQRAAIEEGLRDREAEAADRR